MNAARKKILITIDSAIILRNLGLMSGNVISRLSAQHHVVLLIPPSAEKATRELCAGMSVEIVTREIYRKKNTVQQLFDFFAEHLVFTEGARLHAFYGVRINETRLSVSDRCKYVLKLLIANTLGKSRTIRSVLFPWLRFFVFTDPSMKQLLVDHTPDLIFLSNIHSTYDLAVLTEAKKLGIQTVGMPGSWDHLPKRYVPLRADVLLVQNEVIEREAIEYQDYDPVTVRVVGFPYFDIFVMKDLVQSREAFWGARGLDPRKKVVLFVSSGIYAPDEGDCVDMVLRARASGIVPRDTQFFIRTYPGVSDLGPTRTKEKEKFGPFEGMSGVFVQWIQPKEGFEDPWLPNREDISYFLNLVYHADIIINSFSSIALEAGALMKPLINMRFDGYQTRPYATSVQRYEKLGHYRPVYETGGGLLVESEEALISAVATLLRDPHYNDTNLKKLQDRLCFKIDGKSSERIATEILHLL